MKNVGVISPMARGNGAYIVHRLLERSLPDYSVADYNPFLSVVPFILPVAVSCKGARLIHSAPDYAIFFHLQPIPLIVTFHNYVLDSWMRTYSSKLQWFHYATDLRLWTRMAIKKASVVTAVSQFTANLARQDLGLTKPIRVIYNGIDVNHFTPVAHVRSSKAIKVFFSGNLTRRKGAHWLPPIANKLNNNIQVIYTMGLRSRSSDIFSTGNTRSIGRVKYENMPKHYREMDILLMPTVREGYGLAVAEAMACGLPVVASNCSSIPELIDDEKGGFLCPIGDVDAFVEKVNLLADSSNLRREMGEYNRSKVEKMFTLDRMVKEYRELFEEVLSE